MKSRALLSLTLLIFACDQKPRFDRNEFFLAPESQALIKAIEDSELKKIESIARAGGNLNACGRDEMTPLFWAILKNKKESWRKLLQEGADPNLSSKSRDGIHNYSAMYYASIAEDSEYLEIALSGRGNPNMPDLQDDRTIISSALENHRYKNVEILVKKGADVNFIGRGRKTPLFEAILNADFKGAELLIKLGANPAMKDDQGTSIASLIRQFFPKAEFARGSERWVVDKLKSMNMW
jgi:ankyrin repeat protein